MNRMAVMRYPSRSQCSSNVACRTGAGTGPEPEPGLERGANSGSSSSSDGAFGFWASTEGNFSQHNANHLWPPLCQSAFNDQTVAIAYPAPSTAPAKTSLG